MTSTPVRPAKPEPPYIREQFLFAHPLRDGEEPLDYLNRVIAESAGDAVDPDRLMVVSKTSICELIGVNHTQFNGWNERGYAAGYPPTPDFWTDRGKPGSTILWYLERRVLPWLMGTADGRSILTKMVEDMHAGKLYPPYKRSPSGAGKTLDGEYRTEPVPEVMGKVGRPRKHPVAASA